MTVIELKALIERFEAIGTIDVDGDALAINHGKRRCIMAWSFLDETALADVDAHVVTMLGLP